MDLSAMFLIVYFFGIKKNILYGFTGAGYRAIKMIRVGLFGVAPTQYIKPN